jgi:hypothetical protein
MWELSLLHVWVVSLLSELSSSWTAILATAAQRQMLRELSSS